MTIERKHPGDSNCFCRALHLPEAELIANGSGHCLCACHGQGEHQSDPPCPCNKP